MRWALNGEGRFHLRHWGDDTVIYDETTGATHLMSPVGAEIFEMLAQQPLSTEAIVRQLAEAVGGGAHETFSSNIQETLDKLDMIELIRRLPD
jgi:PqqD family protein of HPr-rel-A system